MLAELQIKNMKLPLNKLQKNYLKDLNQKDYGDWQQ